MSDLRSAAPREKTFTVAVMRIGSHPFIFSVFIIITIGVLVFFLAVVPLVRMLQSGGKASLVDAENRNRIAQSSLDTEKKLADAALSLSTEDRNMLAYALPLEVDAPGLVVMMKSLALASGVKMSTFDVAEPPTESGEAAGAVGRAIITTSIDMATYDRLKIFLTNTEVSLRLFDLKSLSFSPASGSANMQFITYYLNKI